MSAPSTAVLVGQHLATSALAITFWDWAVSLHSEYARVWKGNWNLAKLLYLFNRYWSFVPASVTIWLGLNTYMTPEQCSHVFRLNAALPMWTTLASEAILGFRAYIFLGRDWRLLVLLLAALAGECAFLLWVALKGVVQLPVPVGLCSAVSPAGSVNYVAGIFIAPVVFDSLVTGLIVGRAIQLRFKGVRSGLIHLFVGEGLMYFIVVTTLNIVNMAFFLQPDQQLQPTLSLITIQISSILTCRLVLSLLNPKNAESRSPGTSFFRQTGFESSNDANSQASADILPTTISRLDREERGSGINTSIDKKLHDEERSSSD